MKEVRGTYHSAFGNSFEQFVEFLQEAGTPAPFLSPMLFTQAMCIDLETLAEQAHVHRATVFCAPGSRGIQGFLRDSLRVIKAASDVNGDLHKVLFWYRNEPLSEFGYLTAERLVSAGRTNDLMLYMTSIEAGVTG